MFKFLYKYLALHSKVNIPGVGTFSTRRQPAYLDFTKKVFIAPCPEIVFIDSDVIADGKFYSFLAKEQRIDEPVAVQHFGTFTRTLKENLHSKGELELPGLGWLSRDDAGKLKFKPATQLPAFFPDVPAERPVGETPKKGTEVFGAIHDDQSHLNIVPDANATSAKDYWFVYAMLLAAAAIAAIIYYYNQNGSLR
jgi:nucleoid DNA-binding protein